MNSYLLYLFIIVLADGTSYEVCEESIEEATTYMQGEVLSVEGGTEMCEPDPDYYEDYDEDGTSHFHEAAFESDYAIYEATLSPVPTSAN